MNGWTRVAIKLFRVLLFFYPRRFRITFGEEMQADFRSLLLDFQRSDGDGIWHCARMGMESGIYFGGRFVIGLEQSGKHTCKRGGEK